MVVCSCGTIWIVTLAHGLTPVSLHLPLYLGHQVQTSLSTKLAALKEMLTNEDYFGPDVPVARQRLFYLGRELKSSGRSLSSLGLGKYSVSVLHLHIRPGTDAETSSNKRRRTASDTNEDQSSNKTARAPSSGRRRAAGSGAATGVIDLVDSDEDEEDDDEVEIVL